MDIHSFQNLPVDEIARLVRAAGPKVCVFPVNGTRRWFMLEHPERAAAPDFMETYLRIGGRQNIELYKMFFDHGIDTLLTPVFGPDLLERGDRYRQLVALGLLWFAQDQDFLDFYDAYEVRVRVYGDAQRYLHDAPYARVLDTFDELAQRTASHRRHRLFFGVCAHDATQTVAEIAVRFYQEHGCLPSRRHIIEAYYGEYVEPVDLFIGFGRPTAFDMPLLAIGREDLYFTVAPSPYMDAFTLRAILYDHLYARQVDEASYSTLSAKDWQTLADFYALNRQSVLGLGCQHPSGHFWYPVPQVKLQAHTADAQVESHRGESHEKESRSDRGGQ